MAKITLYNIDTIQNKFFGAGCNSPPAVIVIRHKSATKVLNLSRSGAIPEPTV